MRLSRPNTSDLVSQAVELAQMDLELIVAGALPFALEVRKANPSMPMVIATCPGMISNGFAQSLEHPGGNVTGMDELPPGVTTKRLTLLKTASPKVSRATVAQQRERGPLTVRVPRFDVTVRFAAARL